MFSETRKADRKKMADSIMGLVSTYEGATCTLRDDATHIWNDGSRPAPEYRNQLHLEIEFQDARVHIELNGNRSNSQPNVFCMPWNIQLDSEAKFSSAFGVAVGATVNPYHGRKCMGFAHGFDDLEMSLVSALNCIERGEAFN